MELSIVIPAKNEEKRIPATLAQLCRYIRKKGPLSEDQIEVIVVVNNTTDETYNIVKIFQKHFPFIRVYNTPEAIGKGGAIKLGFEKARGEYIGYLDADGSMSAHNYFKIYHSLLNTEKDIAIGDRYSKESIIVGNVPINRRFFSFGFRTLYRIMFGIKYPDTQCGYKIFKGDVGKYLMANNNVGGWTFDVNVLLIAKLIGAKVVSVPTIWEYKSDSTLNVNKALKSVPIELLGLYWKFSNKRIRSKLEEYQIAGA